MTHDRVVEQLNRLAALLDRARDTARTDASQLTALLGEAEALLTTSVAVPPAPSPAANTALTIASRRARASYAALLQTLRAELAHIGRQLTQVSSESEATTRYSAGPSPSRQLDRIG